MEIGNNDDIDFIDELDDEQQSNEQNRIRSLIIIKNQRIQSQRIQTIQTLQIQRKEKRMTFLPLF